MDFNWISPNHSEKNWVKNGIETSFDSNVSQGGSLLLLLMYTLSWASDCCITEQNGFQIQHGYLIIWIWNLMAHPGVAFNPLGLKNHVKWVSLGPFHQLRPLIRIFWTCQCNYIPLYIWNVSNNYGDDVCMVSNCKLGFWILNLHSLSQNIHPALTKSNPTYPIPKMKLKYRWKHIDVTRKYKEALYNLCSQCLRIWSTSPYSTKIQIIDLYPPPYSPTMCPQMCPYGSLTSTTISAAWSTKVLNVCCQLVTKGHNWHIVICQLNSFVMGEQHVLSTFVLQAVNMHKVGKFKRWGSLTG